MKDPRTDAIAREAARLLDSGRAASVGEAIRAAAEALGFRDAEPPGPGRVRKHARGLAMQALGSDGYAEAVREVWRAAERLMAVLEQAMPDVKTVLAGRAAEGLIDGGVTLNLRLYTSEPIAEIAQALVDFGYEEPVFGTADTRHGRMDRMRLVDEGLEIALIRCPPHLAADADLFTGRPVRTATLAELRRKLADPPRF